MSSNNEKIQKKKIQVIEQSYMDCADDMESIEPKIEIVDDVNVDDGHQQHFEPYDCKTDEEIEYVNVEHLIEEVYLEDHSTHEAEAEAESENDNDYYTILNINDILENEGEKEIEVEGGGHSNDMYSCSKCLIQLSFNDIQDHIKKNHKHEQVLLDMEESTDGDETNEWDPNGTTNHLTIEQLTYLECNVCQEFFTNDQSLTVHLQMHNKNNNNNNTLIMNQNNNINSSKQTNSIDNSNNNLESLLVKQIQSPKNSKPKGAYIKKKKIVSNNKTLPIKKPKQKKIKINDLATEEEKMKSNCNICNTQFKTHKGLLLHMKMHQPLKQRSFQDFLDKRDGVKNNNKKNDDFASADESTTIHNNDEQKIQNKSSLQFYCELCSKSYDKTFETIHLRMHSTEKTDFVCSQCNINFDDENSLSMHLNIVHQEGRIMGQSKHPSSLRIGDDSIKRAYECAFCGKAFLRPHEKVKHERIHTGEKPHVCEICGKGFRVTYCLTLHMRTHTTDRPYVCIHCNKRFKSNSVYSHHLMTHSDVRAYSCPFCPKQFKTAVQLAGHKNSHTKPFTCTECNRPFASLYAVRNHMKVHSKTNHNLRYSCDICGATYARSFALKDHMKENHPKAKMQPMAVATKETATVSSSSSSLITNIADEHLQSEIFNDNQSSSQQHQQQPSRKLRSSILKLKKPKKYNKKSNAHSISQTIAFDSTLNLLTNQHLIDNTINDYGDDLQPEVVNDEPIILSMIAGQLPVVEQSNMESQQFSAINDNNDHTIPNFDNQTITSFI